MFKLADEQKECIETVCNLLKGGKDIVTVAGPAGSGKTTIINSIIQKLELLPEQVQFATFTGKAALVLRNKGIPASTIHKLIYDCYEDYSTGKIVFHRKKFLDNIFCKLIVIDEIGMVGKKLLDDLMYFKIPIIGLGDPYQVQPVLDDPTNLLYDSDYSLKEIHRQEDGNSIIELGEQLRQRKNLFCEINDSFVRPINKDNLDIGMLFWADQILCSTHKIRKELNNLIRREKGYKNIYPEIGEKLICLKNYWNIVSNKEKTPLVNGTIGYITAINDIFIGELNKYMDVEFRPDWDLSEYYNIRIDLNNFYNLSPYKNSKNSRIKRVEMDFGYAITIHKSQGSEWDKVLVYSKDAFGDKYRLLYTAVTRASKKVLYIQ